MGARLALLLSLFVLPATASADYWEYRTDSGTLAYTDDTQKIPARYRGSAVKRQNRSLSNYARLSVSKPGASIASTKTGLDLGALEREEARRRGRLVVARTAPMGMGLELTEGVLVPLTDEIDEPYVVERNQYLTRSDGVTTTFTIVTKGGRPLAIINE